MDPGDSWDNYQALLDLARQGDGAYRRAGTWAVAELRTRLGEDWPLRAGQEHHPLVAALRDLPARTLSLVAAVEWAARLKLLEAAEGRADLARDLIRDVTAARGLHTELMLETAGLAQRLGWSVRLEPHTTDAPADIELAAPQGSLSIEARVLTEAASSRRERERIDEIADRLMLAGAVHGVWIGGNAGSLDDEQLAVVEEWIGRMAAVAEDGKEPSLRIGDADLTLQRRDAASLLLRSATVAGDLWPRMEAALIGKAIKMAGSGAGWLRVTLFTGIWRFSPWGQAALAVKLSTLAQNLRPIVAGHQIDGIVISSAAGLYPGDVPEDRVATQHGTAIRRAVRPLRARETLILPFSDSGARETDAWVALADAEHDWLDWALERNRLPPLDEILAITPP